MPARRNAEWSVSRNFNTTSFHLDQLNKLVRIMSIPQHISLHVITIGHLPLDSSFWRRWTLSWGRCPCLPWGTCPAPPCGACWTCPSLPRQRTWSSRLARSWTRRRGRAGGKKWQKPSARSARIYCFSTKVCKAHRFVIFLCSLDVKTDETYYCKSGKDFASRLWASKTKANRNSAMARTEPPLPWNLLFTCSCPPRFLVKSKHNQDQKGIWRPHLTIHHLFTGLETTKVKNVEQKPLLLRVKLWSERGTVDKWSQRKGGRRVREKTDSVSPYFVAL